jgi:thiamine kinase-like enzyme
MAAKKNDPGECEICGDDATVHLTEVDRRNGKEIARHLCEKHAPPLPKLDANQSAALAVFQIIAKHEKPLPADLEAAWAQWSAGVGRVDTRTMTLMRAAFEAGAEAAQSFKT